MAVVVSDYWGNACKRSAGEWLVADGRWQQGVGWHAHVQLPCAADIGQQGCVLDGDWGRKAGCNCLNLIECNCLSGSMTFVPVGTAASGITLNSHLCRQE